MHYMFRINIRSTSDKPNIRHTWNVNTNWKIPTHLFITDSKIFSFPLSNTHTHLLNAYSLSQRPCRLPTTPVPGRARCSHPSQGRHGCLSFACLCLDCSLQPASARTGKQVPREGKPPERCWSPCVVSHPAVPLSLLESSGSWQLFGRLLCPAWAVVVMLRGGVLQHQTRSDDCCGFHCKVSPLPCVEYFHVFFRLLLQLYPSVLQKPLCLSHRLLFSATEGWLPL